MALFQNGPKTSQQKAQKAQLSITARLIACGYLVYIVVKLLRAAPEDDTLNPTLKMVIAVVLLIAAAVVVFMTVFEFIRKWRGGLYKSESYTDDPVPDTDGESGADEER